MKTHQKRGFWAALTGVFGRLFRKKPKKSNSIYPLR